MWRRQWEQVIPFFAYPPDVRKMIYTTNAIESLHMQLRKIVKIRGHFPNDQAAKKLRFLALRNIEKNWKMPPVIWKRAANPFAILFGKRLTHKIPGSTCRCAGQSAGFYTHGCQCRGYQCR